MRYKIKAFGIVKDIVGGREVELELSDGTTVAGLLTSLQSIYPRLISLNTLFVAVNREYAGEDRVITVNDEIALIPPVSGG